ncbi:4Fe-4S dicluster domain-containing protein [Methanotrichaceae archaeon M04Ac]|uniref:4Fe-4S dicluster domain-containing protein n=1 Tax=Candidatus Methanocrinis alkalitolerans TaxID=3033395 RepID=A0ABT5XG88_9EURY|nr:4Fe-4S dicluster domain-containing protein [Candidatus Methanocrinis alkalitolerans]MCR3883420.1 4Fe-4S dicluster domain-containing protein [Methanothrix sp.]MDF0593729.1 4Fe-4S dicluster domain-containing protein [Candidatus Methanocrinis alkalitolerans]
MTGTSAFFLRREDLVPLLEELAETLEVVAPVLVEGEAAFATWRGGALALDDKNPLASPMEFFLPKKEVLFRYVQYSGRYTFSEDPPRARLIFGMRPCDLQALKVIDGIFGAELPDIPYAGRRRSTIIVALNCTSPGEGCFCRSMGSGPGAEGGYDLLLTDLGRGYLVEPGSPAGVYILRAHQRHFEEADPEDQREKERLLALAGEEIIKRGPSLNPEKIREAIDGVDWEEAGRRCLACGGCSLVCPVCHCFSVLDQGVPDGERLRCRDTCILSGFSRMTSGANPRPALGERLRHWYLDKFVYIPEKTGLFGCVGCGRCSRVCLGEVDRWSLFKEAAE